MDETTTEADLRTVGLLGGMSPASTTVYYEEIVAGVNDARGGHAAAPIAAFSVDFGAIEPMVRGEQWDEAGAYLAQRARRVERAGAAFLVMATNTMHRVADEIAAAIEIPFVHIVDPVAEAARNRGIDTLGVLGTRVTMAGEFYHDRFAHRGIDTLAPDPETQRELDRIVFEELVHEQLREDSRERFRAAIDRLRDRGAEGVVFGCTEIELLLDETALPVPAFDTTTLHVDRAVDLCLGRRPIPE